VQFLATNPNVKRSQDRIDAVEGRMKAALESNDLEALRQLIIDEEIKCPVSGTANWTEVRQFNLMFATELGSVSGESSTIYLRPETAQGIFVNYLNVQKSARMKIPFGIAQTGKAFRNEIVARQFVFRMREFEQMEMQFFVKPGTEMEWYETWKAKRIAWHKAHWACRKRTTASTITSSWRTMPTRLAISSSSSPWASRSWRASTAAPTST
jgi:glycyl-tRNA synthetase